MPKNIDVPLLGQLDWSTEHRAESIASVFSHTTSLCAAAEEWYAAKRPAKRLWGRALRVASLLLALVAAVLPVISEITSTGGKPAVAPGWAAVALAGAAACVGLDRYFGFSSGWMRFMTAGQQLARQRQAFEYAWNELLVIAESPPTEEEAARFLELARGSVTMVQDIIDAETSSWASEFSGALADSERSLSRRPAA